MTFPDKFYYLLLKKYVNKVLSLHQPFLIGVIGDKNRLVNHKIIKVLNDKYEGQVQSSYEKMGSITGILLAVLGYKKIPSLIVWPFLLGRAYLKTFKKEFPKLLILNVDINADMLDILPDMVKFNFLIVNNSTERINNPLSLLLKDNGRVFLNADKVRWQGLTNEVVVKIGVKNVNVDFRAINTKFNSDLSYRIVSKGQNIVIKSKIKSKNDIYAELLAFSIGLSLGIQSLNVKKMIEKD
jgi:hypothetical protein